jgi:hypothetical protein
LLSMVGGVETIKCNTTGEGYRRWPIRNLIMITWLCIGFPLPILILIMPAVMRVSMLRRTAALIFSKNTRRASVRYESQIKTNKAYSSMPNATNCTMRKSNHHTAARKTSSSRKAA